MELRIVLDFLSDLSKNNNRDWFTQNRKKYEFARKVAENFVEQIIVEIRKFDDQIPELKTKDCFFRINRDVRFSNDKSPYKTNFGAFITKGNRKGPYSGYYIHFESGSCFLAGGIYMPEPETLKALRDEIYFNYTNFNKIISNKEFIRLFDKIEGDSLVKVPKQYPADHPGAEYLKLKSFSVVHSVNEKQVCNDSYLQYATGVFKTMLPMNHFLNFAVDNISGKV
jgi:uncharacterized protein (TIGR02453 family)